MTEKFTISQINTAYEKLRSGKGTDILTRIAKQCDINSFIDCVQQSELPPVKLSQADMEVLKGGGLKNAVKLVLVPLVSVPKATE